jgi:hypothetical protein
MFTAQVDGGSPKTYAVSISIAQTHPCPSHTPRPGLTRADREGMERLSMRALAGDLGVEAMSLYNHVRNKEDLIDGMVEAVLG